MPLGCKGVHGILSHYYGENCKYQHVESLPLKQTNRIQLEFEVLELFTIEGIMEMLEYEIIKSFITMGVFGHLWAYLGAF
jgi:hypothetical protein